MVKLSANNERGGNYQLPHDIIERCICIQESVSQQVLSVCKKTFPTSVWMLNMIKKVNRITGQLHGNKNQGVHCIPQYQHLGNVVNVTTKFVR